MSRLIEVAFGFPTAIFTTLALFSLGYWVIALAFGLADFGVEADMDADLGTDAGGSDGGSESGSARGHEGVGFSALFTSLGLHHVPLPVAFSLVSIIAWLVSLIATWLITSSGGSAAVLVGLLVIFGAVAVGIVVAGRLALMFRPVFEEPAAVTRSDLIGRICVVQTGRVDAEFGQAEVVDREKSTHLVQVRCEIANDLSSGAKALIVDVDDDGLFVVSPDVDAIT